LIVSATGSGARNMAKVSAGSIEFTTKLIKALQKDTAIQGYTGVLGAITLL